MGQAAENVRGMRTRGPIKGQLRTTEYSSYSWPARGAVPREAHPRTFPTKIWGRYFLFVVRPKGAGLPEIYF